MTVNRLEDRSFLETLMDQIEQFTLIFQRNKAFITTFENHARKYSISIKQHGVYPELNHGKLNAVYRYASGCICNDQRT